MGSYDVMQVCLNGHKITDHFNSSPENRKDFCGTCGKSTIHKCRHCNADIRGFHYIDGAIVISSSETPIPAHCDSCGKPYPWTKRKTKTKKMA